MYALVNCDVFTSDKVLNDHAVVIDNNQIVEVIAFDDLDKNIKYIDLKGRNLTPGFIDIQVNGGGGKLFNDNPSVETIEKISRAHKQFGTTKILPTLITDDNKKVAKAISAVDEYLSSKNNGILGLHIEGPFIESKKAGVHNKKYIRSMEDSDFNLFSSLRHGKTLITVAPEKVTKEQIKELIQEDVLVSIGHTNATAAECEEIFNAGATLATHLYNAMSPLTSREPGAVGASLINDNVYVSIIVDGFHVDYRALIPVIKTKPKGKIILVTDAMPPVGSDKKTFYLEPYNISVAGGKCVTEDGVLAGSALSMNIAIRNCVQNLGVPLNEAYKMATLYPAEFLQVSNQYGKIKAGYIADLVISDNELNIYGIVEEGTYIEYN